MWEGVFVVVAFRLHRVMQVQCCECMSRAGL